MLRLALLEPERSRDARRRRTRPTPRAGLCNHWRNVLRCRLHGKKQRSAQRQQDSKDHPPRVDRRSDRGTGRERVMLAAVHFLAERRVARSLALGQVISLVWNALLHGRPTPGGCRHSRLHRVFASRASGSMLESASMRRSRSATRRTAAPDANSTPARLTRRAR